MNLIIIIIIITCLILIYESWIKRKNQNESYNEANKLSKIKNKKLLVIGNPGESNTNYFFGKYGCGDICVDLNGCICDKYSNNTIIIKDKLENVTKNFETDSVVIFETEVLEYVDDTSIDYVIDELYRISGGDIFSVHELKPGNIFTSVKQNGYKFFNFLFGKKIFECKRLFKKYPPKSSYEYVKY